MLLAWIVGTFERDFFHRVGCAVSILEGSQGGAVQRQISDVVGCAVGTQGALHTGDLVEDLQHVAHFAISVNGDGTEGYTTAGQPEGFAGVDRTVCIRGGTIDGVVDGNVRVVFVIVAGVQPDALSSLVGLRSKAGLGRLGRRHNHLVSGA